VRGVAQGVREVRRERVCGWDGALACGRGGSSSSSGSAEEAGAGAGAEGMRWSQVRAWRRAGMREGGRTVASADLSDGRSLSGMVMLNFCSRARRVREGQRSRTMVLEDSRRPMVLKECIRDAKPGYLVRAVR
jgi:hypothetical protein